MDITSADRLYRAWQRTLRQGVRTATVPSIPGALRSAFLGGAFGEPGTDRYHARRRLALHFELAVRFLEVAGRLEPDGFGQSGSVSDLYRAHDLDSGSIVNAALAALSLR